ncbi:MAG: hypothetical protein V1835_03855 [Candidatus Micrarchaeota archaeon]
MAEIATTFDSPDALAQGVTEVIRNFFGAMAQFIPNFIAALVIFLVGYLIAIVLSKIVKRVLEASNFEKFLADNKMADALGNVKISHFFVKVVKYYIILVFLQAAISKLELGTLTQFINMVLMYAPAVVGAAVIVVVSAMIGELAKAKVKEVDLKSKWVMLLGRISKFVIVFMGLVMGLSAVGFNTLILKEAFITLLQALAYGIALGIGIAFGFGGQDEAKAIINDVKKKINK